MGLFVADPYVIEQKGIQILRLSESFTDNINKMDQTIDELVSSDYVSPEAKVLGNEIKRYRKSLEDIRNVMANYGNFGKQTGNAVLSNQADLASDVRANV